MVLDIPVDAVWLCGGEPTGCGVALRRRASTQRVKGGATRCCRHLTLVLADLTLRCTPLAHIHHSAFSGIPNAKRGVQNQKWSPTKGN